MKYLLSVCLAVQLASCESFGADPVDLYNDAVGINNSDIYQQTYWWFGRIADGYGEDGFPDLIERTEMQVQFLERNVAELESEGNDDDYGMLDAARALGNWQLSTWRDPRLQSFLEAAQRAETYEELEAAVAATDGYYESFEEERAALFEDLNAKTTAFAEANGIEEDIINPYPEPIE